MEKKIIRNSANLCNKIDFSRVFFQYLETSLRMNHFDDWVINVPRTVCTFAKKNFRRKLVVLSAKRMWKVIFYCWCCWIWSQLKKLASATKKHREPFWPHTKFYFQLLGEIKKLLKNKTLSHGQWKKDDKNRFFVVQTRSLATYSLTVTCTTEFCLDVH